MHFTFDFVIFIIHIFKYFDFITNTRFGGSTSVNRSQLPHSAAWLYKLLPHLWYSTIRVHRLNLRRGLKLEVLVCYRRLNSSCWVADLRISSGDPAKSKNLHSRRWLVALHQNSGFRASSITLLALSSDLQRVALLLLAQYKMFVGQDNRCNTQLCIRVLFHNRRFHCQTDAFICWRFN